eukprot:293369-Lingulodinium_polyedra.AAC.1
MMRKASLRIFDVAVFRRFRRKAVAALDSVLQLGPRRIDSHQHGFGPILTRVWVCAGLGGPVMKSTQADTQSMAI